MSGDISIRFSRKVVIVSFILSVFVMYIHAKNLAYYDFGDVQGTFIYGLNQIMSETLGRIAVPFFFLQSGYWMFRYDIFDTKSDILRRKLKKKVISLGIPYLIWNTFGLLFFIIMTHISGILFGLYSGQDISISLSNVVEGIILHKFYLPFWFMQDLIVLTVLSMLGINTPVCQTSSILLFTIGGALSAYHREYWEKPNGSHFETAFYIILFLILAVIKWLSIPFFYTIYIVLSPILFWKSCELLGEMNLFDHEPLWFCKQSFFVYSAHIFPVEGLSSILSRVSGSMVWAFFSYIITPLVALGLLYVTARILAHTFPKVYKLLCGGRNS